MSTSPQTLIETKAGFVRITWIDCFERAQMEPYQPCTQVYGVCFNEAGQILLIDEKGDGTWKPMGGTPEIGETPEQTLIRELIEEADVVLEELIPAGVQKVEELFPDPQQPKVYYQWRFTGKIAHLYPQTPDPDTGIIYPRRFVSPQIVNDIVKWGDTGRALFAAAVLAMGRASAD